MKIRILFLLCIMGCFSLASILLSCEDNGDDDDDDSEKSDDDDDVTEFILYSPAFKDGEPIPLKYSCENEDYDQGVSMPLSWINIPEGTKFFALTMYDPDANDTPHWGVFDIPVVVTEFTDALRPDNPLPDYAWEAIVYTGNAEYAGPCPPSADEAHHYVITIYALNEGMPDFDTTPNLIEMDHHIQERLLDSATIIGIFDSVEE